MMSANDMLIAAAVRRNDRGATLRHFERMDAANRSLGVGPDPERVTTAVMLRNVDPDRPRLNRALAALADETAGHMLRTPEQRATTTPLESIPPADTERCHRCTRLAPVGALRDGAHVYAGCAG